VQNCLVDIKGPALAFLPVLAFEGGTRRNIPKFEVCKNYLCILELSSGRNVQYFMYIILSFYGR
jgi:exosome complex component RRP40